MKGVYIFMADGFEDVEALATNDVLRRGGVDVQLVSIGDEPFVSSSHGITIGVDLMLSELDCDDRGTDASDFMIFPGGLPGSRNLASCKQLIKLMNGHFAAGGSVAAICAAPGLVLSQLDGVAGIDFTCFDGFEAELEAAGAFFTPEPSVISGRVITGRSAGHAVSFAIAILRAIKGDAVAASVNHAMYLD